jgi:phosphoglycolate phosphatase
LERRERTYIRHHILFDLDGTLTDPAEGICGSVSHALRTLGRPVPGRAALERFIGPPLDESFAACGMEGGEITRAIDAFREYFAEHGLKQNQPIFGIDGLLARLRAGGRTLHVATTKPLYLAAQVLDGFGLTPYFTRICGSGPAHAGRPKAEVVAEVLADGRIGAGDAVMVGDRRHDVAGARANGLPCVGVLFGYGSDNELREAGAAHLAADVSELERIIDAYY